MGVVCGRGLLGGGFNALFSLKQCVSNGILICLPPKWLRYAQSSQSIYNVDNGGIITSCAESALYVHYCVRFHSSLKLWLMLILLAS